MAALPQLMNTEMTDAEWQARCDLAALYHVVNHLGWTDTINTHFSVRVPGEPDTFLINNYGEMFDEVTASSLVKMDFDGNVRGDSGKFNNAGFTIHSGVYRARADANCVTHTHTRAGAGVSLIEKGIRPISQDALHVYDDVAYHPYGVPATTDECEALGRTCQQGSCVVLMNHGLLTFGPTVHGAFQRLYTLERACELELIARQMGVAPVMVEPPVVQAAATRMQSLRDTETYGLMEWQGLVRTVEKQGADFRR
ncbi:MAG TPA: class II aldolase/adducin family protein [Stellaceae bacterium]|jgi:ribulose-5-phosphate 4-epimerase/fuculose-1-phosphate aldolase|nr:class II aldolase/adducin family protein [Stellaceae bacterium]